MTHQVSFNIRECYANEAGEMDGTICIPCPVSYYNVDSSQPCQGCPKHAVCTRPDPMVLTEEVCVNMWVWICGCVGGPLFLVKVGDPYDEQKFIHA
jgi:hypothetical protein